MITKVKVQNEKQREQYTTPKLIEIGDVKDKTLVGIVGGGDIVGLFG